MKKLFVISALVLSTIGIAQSSERLCYDAELRFNTHPNRECPALKSFCLKGSETGDMLLTLASGEQTLLAFNGIYRISHSDVGQDIYNSYTGAINLNLSYNNDGDYPATVTGGFSSISLSTGVVERSGVYVSQACYYDVK